MSREIPPTRCAGGPLRFKDLQIKLKVGPKVLARELKELEQNLLILPTIKKTKPIAVEYSTTECVRETRWLSSQLSGKPKMGLVVLDNLIELPRVLTDFIGHLRDIPLFHLDFRPAAQ